MTTDKTLIKDCITTVRVPLVCTKKNDKMNILLYMTAVNATEAIYIDKVS